MYMEDFRMVLRKLKTLEGPLPTFDPVNVPPSPYELFQEWFQFAIERQISEPHAMTLSTVNQLGYPDARVLILKDVDEDGWYFASSTRSMKGQQLKINPHVSLTFYWSELGRQIRIRGTTLQFAKRSSEKDFLERGEVARAIALIGRQSNRLHDVKVLEEAVIEQVERIKKDPQLMDHHWCLYKVRAREVEFWQGDEERRHIRLLYRRTDGNIWIKERLWP